MSIIIRGSTAVCSIRVTSKSTGALISPDTSMQITIWDPNGKVVVDDEAMTEDSTGLFHYDYTSTDPSSAHGEYFVLYAANNGGRISQETDVFNLKPKDPRRPYLK